MDQRIIRVRNARPSRTGILKLSRPANFVCVLECGCVALRYSLSRTAHLWTAAPRVSQQQQPPYHLTSTTFSVY